MADVISTQTDVAGNAIKYNGFPFISNIDMYVQNELSGRALDRVRTIVPYVKITPGFSVDGSESSKIVMKGIEAPNDKNPSEYTFKELYRPDSFFRPLAGVRNVTVDYKNVYGSIRQAKISWICHTLEDLERLSPYFLNPGYSIFIEWGWSNYAKDVISNEAPVDLSNYFEYARIRQKQTNGNYDAMLGIVTNYSFSMNKDGGFECITDVVSSGYLMEGMTVPNQFTQDASRLRELLLQGDTKDEAEDKIKKENEKKAEKKAEEDAKILRTLENFLKEKFYAQIKNHLRQDIFKDINAEHDYFLLRDTTGRNDDRYLVNGEGRRTKEIDRTVTTQTIPGIPVGQNSPSITPSVVGGGGNVEKTVTVDIPIRASVYASWGYLEDYVLNPHIKIESDDGKVLFGFDSRDSKIGYHENLRTTDLGVCILPTPLNEKVATPDFKRGEKNDTIYNFGYARRVLINVEFFKEVMLSATTVLDGVLQVWSAINDACINFWDLKMTTSEEYYDDSENEENQENPGQPIEWHPINQGLPMGDMQTRAINRYTIIDVNYAETVINSELLKNDNFYIFRTKGFQITDAATNAKTETTSVVKNLVFTSKLSSMAALNVFYSAQNADGRILGAPQTNTFRSLYDFGIGGIDSNKITDTFSISKMKIKSEENKQANPDGTVVPDPGTVTERELQEQASYGDDLLHFLPWGGDPSKVDSKGWYVKIGDKFLSGIEGMKMAVLLKDDNNSPVTSTALVPLVCDIEVQGISGLRIGNVFTFDHVPKIYQQHGLFQIIGLTETLDKNSWITKIRSQFRVFNNIDYIGVKSDTPFTLQSLPTGQYIDVRKFNNTFVTKQEKDEILDRIRDIWTDITVEGFVASDQIINDAEQIVYRESGYSHTAINLRVPDYSLGLFQINMISSPPGKYKLREERTGAPFVLLGIIPGKTATTENGDKIDEFNLWDIDTNIRVAKKIFKDASYSWYPWATRIHLHSNRQKNSLASEISFTPLGNINPLIT